MTTKTLFALLTLIVTVLLWIAATVGTVIFSLQSGNGGAVLMAMFVFCVGATFAQDARTELGATL